VAIQLPLVKMLASILTNLCIVGCLCVEDEFVSALTDRGLQVDRLKTDANLSTAGPYYLAINLTHLTVSVTFICICYVVVSSLLVMVTDSNIKPSCLPECCISKHSVDPYTLLEAMHSLASLVHSES